MNTNIYHLNPYWKSLIVQGFKPTFRKCLNNRSFQIFLVMYLLFGTQLVNAQFANVPVTGFNSDQVANGIGVPTSSTTAATDAGVDNGNYVFIDGTYQYNAGCVAATTGIYPASATIASTAASGLIYNLQAASGNNALRIPATGTAASTGTLTVTTPVQASTIYLLTVAGGGVITSGINVTINFTDLTSQTTSNITAEDWCNTTNNGNYTKITGTQYNRVQALTATCGSQGTCQYFAELAVAVNPANYGKQIASVTIAKTTSTNVFNIYAMGIKPPCAAPTAQATALVTGTITTSSIAGSFTAASPAPTGTGGYLVVRYPQGNTPATPVNGTVYSANQALGTGTVVSSFTSTSFTASALSGGTSYDLYVYTFNSNTDCGGPIYYATAPLMSTVSTSPCGGTLSGTVMIGPGLLNTPASGYTSLTAALAEINTNGLGGNTILELQTGYDGTAPNETFPLNFATNPCVGSTRTLTIRPASSVTDTLVITASNAGATVNLNGMSYVTFDGRPGGSGSDKFISIVNTSATGAAVQFINDAHHNTFTYCDIEGQNTSATSSALSGVVYFSTANASLLNGNDFNTLSFCDVHATPTGFPAIGICSYGSVTSTTSWNDYNTITDCNIYDYFSPSVATTGIKLENGSNAFTINNNRFYQQATRTYTTGVTHRALWLTPVTASAASPAGFIVTNNYIGASTSAGTGTYTLGGAVAVSFWGMDINHWGTEPSSIQGNTITSISVSSTITGTGTDFFRGISTGSAGNVNIGTIAGNTIGSSTTTGAITLSTTGTGTNSYGIKNGSTSSSTDTIKVYNNNIGGISVSSTTSTSASHLYGVAVISGSYTYIEGNTIGSTVVTNSLNSPNPSTAAQIVYGVSVPTLLTNHVVRVNNNTIANLNNGFVGATTGYTRGISVLSSASATINGNKVKNLSTASTYTGSTTLSCLMGIIANTANAVTIEGNTVDSLVLTNASSTAASYIVGIYVGSAGTTPTYSVSKNFVHSFGVASTTNTSVFMHGIEIAGGANIVKNNMVRLGVNPDGTDFINSTVIRGIYLNTTTANNFYHNTVYIGGANVGSTVKATAAFQRASSGVHIVRNNIFVNNRSNATVGAGGKHYQLMLNNTTTLTLNNNIYYGSGNDVVFASANGGTSDTLNYKLNWIPGDWNSGNGNPQLNTPTGTASTVDLHIHSSNPSTAESAGVLIAGITDDIDGDVRATNTPTDIGADAGNFTGVNMAIDSTVVTQITTTSTKVGQKTQGIIGVQFYAKNGGSPLHVTSFDFHTALTSSNLDIENAKVFWTGSQNTFDTLIQFGSTLSVIPSGAFSVVGDTVLEQGLNCFWLTYDVKPGATPGNIIDARLDGVALTGAVSANILNGGDPVGSRTIRGPLNGNYTVGVGRDYTTLTAAIADLKILGVSNAVTFTLKDALYNATSGEVYPITVNAIDGASATNTITVVPDPLAVSRIEGNNATAIIDLNGAKYFIIDGRQGGSGGFVPGTNLQIANTGTAGPAVRFINDAMYNTLRYVDLKSNNATATATAGAGVVNFGTTTGVNGNDTNLIEYCDIHEDASGFPLIGISSIGSATTVATNNEGITINECNIYNFFAAGTASAGMYIGSNNGGWTITNNHVFQQASRTYTSAVSHRGFWITPNTGTLTSASGFNISNNFIGASAADETGTYTMTGTVNYLFYGMDLSLGIGPMSTVSNNVITKVNMTGANTGSAFYGLNIANGIVDCESNTFGSTSVNGEVQYTSSSNGGAILPYRVGGGSFTLFKFNIASGVSITGSTTTTAVNFFGMNLSGGTVVVADSNYIGYPSLANSISLGVNTSTTGSVFVGIISNPGAITTHTISNNQICNVNNAYSGASTAPSVRALNIAPTSTGAFYATDNIVEQIKDSASSTGTGANAAMIGLLVNTTTATSVTVSKNIIRSLVLTSPTGAVQASGICVGAPTTGNHLVERNLVHSLTLGAPNNTAIFNGIELSSGKVTASNNMIRLGIDSTGASIADAQAMRGILKSSTTACRVFFNTVYIGGSGNGANLNRSSAFARTGTAVDTTRNNIFINQRTNTTPGGGGHFAASLSNSTTLAMDYNLLAADSIGLFNNNAQLTLTNWKSASGIDANSISGAAGLMDPIGTTTTLNLHVSTLVPTPVEGGGIADAGLGSDIDFDGDTRSTLTPVDLGADAGIFMPNDIAPPVVSFTPLTNTIATTDQTVTATISDATAVYLSGLYQPRIYFKKMASGTYFSAPGTMVSGNASSSVWNFTISASAMSGLSPNDSVYYYVIAQDSTPAKNVGSFPGGVDASDVNTINTHPGSPAGYWIIPSLSGTYTVGHTVPCNYSSITQAINLISASMVTGPVVLELMDPLYDNTTETFPLVFSSTLGFDATKTLTLRPGTGVTALIKDSITNTIIDLNGIDYMTIDGRQGGTGTAYSLTIQNRSISNVGYGTAATPAANPNAIRYINGATHNTIQYVNLEGASQTNLSGVVFFSIGSTEGNSYNTIDTCNIRNVSGLLPPNNIFVGLGTATDSTKFNRYNVITRNSISNFFSSTAESNAFKVSKGNSDWTISYNHFFQTDPLTGTGGTQYLMNLNRRVGPTVLDDSYAYASLQNMVITYNYIGGSAPYATGTTWSITGNGPNFFGIYGEYGTSGRLRLSNNTFTNFEMTQNVTGNRWVAINDYNGLADIDSNTIGSMTGLNSIVMNSTVNGTGVQGIATNFNAASTPAGLIRIRYNQMGGITVNGNATTSVNFTGINVGNTSSNVQTYEVDYNTIGNGLAGNIITTGASTSATLQNMVGISTSNGANFVVRNNKIQNMTNTYGGTSAATTVGISYTSGQGTIQNNTISNLVSSAAQTSASTTNTVSVMGIYNGSAATGHLISGNTVRNLVNANVGSIGVGVVGINTNGAGNTTLSGNTVYGLGVVSTSPSAYIYGVSLNSANTTNMYNNMVSAGLDTTGVAMTNTPSITGVYKTNTGSLAMFHNTVLIEGSGVGTDVGNTYAFRRNTSGVDSLINNVLVNTRNNATLGGGHYAVGLNASASLVSNSNIYNVAAMAGDTLFTSAGVPYQTLSAWQTFSGTDAQSKDTVMAFAGVNDLHLNASYYGLYTLIGAPLTSVTTDFDNEARVSYAPYIGADEVPGSPLPVTLLSFTGNVNGNDVILNWATGSETNNKGFVIERSVDGRAFGSVGFVAGTNTQRVQRYSLTDRSAFIQSKVSVLYYRLKQQDHNSNVSYSEIIKVETTKQDNKLSLQLYPNPFTSELNMTVAANTEGLAKLELIDIHGKVIVLKSMKVTKGVNTLNLTDVNELPLGVYFVKVTVDGIDSYSKVVKH